MDQGQRDFIKLMSEAAEQAGCIFPTMQACEAALESGFGTSKLAIEALNIFGTKQHKHPVYGTLTLPTREYLDGQWVVVDADWVLYPTVADCFADRMQTLKRLASVYPHYMAALSAPDEFTYVQEVSKTWSTDPTRAAKVIQIYQIFMSVPGGQ